MNLRKEILREHSKAQCEKIVNWVGSNQDRFDELFKLFIHDEYRVVQRASWPLSICVDNNPYFIRRHWKYFIANLEKPGIHNAVKRNSIRLMQRVSIPVRYHGAVMNICFNYLQSPTEPVAIKTFALTVLANLSNEYPGIIPEIKLIIEELLPNQTAAFKNRAGKLLAKWNRK